MEGGREEGGRKKEKRKRKQKKGGRKEGRTQHDGQLPTFEFDVGGPF